MREDWWRIYWTRLQRWGRQGERRYREWEKIDKGYIELDSSGTSAGAEKIRVQPLVEQPETQSEYRRCLWLFRDTRQSTAMWSRSPESAHFTSFSLKTSSLRHTVTWLTTNGRFAQLEYRDSFVFRLSQTLSTQIRF